MIQIKVKPHRHSVRLHVQLSALNRTFFTTFGQKESCSKGILPVPVFYGWCRAPAESDPRWSWSDKKPQTASPPWKQENKEKTEEGITSARPADFWDSFHQLPVLLQGSVDILSCSLHEGAADGGARDGNLFGNGGERWAESLGSRAGHGAQLAAKRNHRIHHHLRTKHEPANIHYVRCLLITNTLAPNQLFMHIVSFWSQMSSSANNYLYTGAPVTASPRSLTPPVCIKVGRSSMNTPVKRPQRILLRFHSL